MISKYALVWCQEKKPFCFLPTESMHPMHARFLGEEKSAEAFNLKSVFGLSTFLLKLGLCVTFLNPKHSYLVNSQGQSYYITNSLTTVAKSALLSF